MFLIISNQIVKMFLIMITGYLCYRARLVSHEGNKTLSNLLLMVINPLLVISTFQTEYTPELMRGCVISFLLAVLTHVVGIAIAYLCIPAKASRDSNIERFSCIFSNCAFMGIPLISSILGNEGVLYITAYSVAFNLFCWTQGLILMTGNTSWQQVKKGLTSPMIIGIVIGLTLFVCRISLPPVLSDSISYLASMNTPVGMLIAGVALAETDLLQALKNRRLYLVTALKLLLVPLIMIVLFSFLPIDKNVLYTIAVAAACPAATTGTMFALRYDANYRYASEIFAFSTLVSLVTIPLMVSLAERLFL